MIGTLARKRTNLVAVAALLALLAAGLWAALGAQPASAQSSQMTATPGDMEITVTFADAEDAEGDLLAGEKTLRIRPTGGEFSTAPITLTGGNGTHTFEGLTNGVAYRIVLVGHGAADNCGNDGVVVGGSTINGCSLDGVTPVAPNDSSTSDAVALEVFLSDGDGIVAAPAVVEVTILPLDIDGNRYRNSDNSDARSPGASLWITGGGTGLSFDRGIAGVIRAEADGSGQATVYVAPNTLAGVYTITAVSGSLRGEATITVGSPGRAVGTANLTFAKVDPNGAYAPRDDTATEDSPLARAAAAGDAGKVFLRVTALNSLGNLADNHGVAQVTIIAPNAHLQAAGNTNPSNVSRNSIEWRGTDSKAVMDIAVSAGAPGQYDVYAIVIGTTGAATSESVTLTFAGPPHTLTVGAPSGSLHHKATDGPGDNRDVITLSVSAVDKAGNPAAISSSGVRVKAPNGATVPTSTIDAGGGVINAKGKLTLTNMGTLALGEYTIDITENTNARSSSTFMVAGDAAAISLAVDDAAPDTVGGMVTATATVTDSEGTPVANGTQVSFRGSDLAGDADAVMVATTQYTDGVNNIRPTAGGAATNNYVVVGPGRSVLTASVNRYVDVTVVTSTAGAESVVPDEAGLDCLSNASGFSTWTCGVEASASELFGMVSARGASAVHLWNGDAWVRYAIVDGAMVPGSSDFTITDNDILYVSN